MLAPGTRVGRYEIEATLGRGGMGCVYRAHDPELLRSVAVKVLEEGGGTEGRARFVREARAAARLHHAHAVTVFDVGQTEDGTPYIAMELVLGTSLRVEVTRKKGADLTKRVQWLRQIAEVLHAAHVAGIVHRDVKPENVMIRSSDRAAKVLDFGIARAPTLTMGDPLGAFTGEGEIVGTLVYMSPEQLRSDSIDGLADQFGWGITAFEVLTGKLPWRATSSMKVATEILASDGVSPRQADGEIPPRLDEIVKRATRRDRGERFPDMQQLLLELDDVEAELVSGVAETETSIQVHATTAAPVRRSKKVLWLLPAIVGLLGFGALAGRRGPAPTKVEADVAGDRSHCARPGADDAYARGLHAWRVESEHVAAREMDLAATADPACGGARLWLAFFYYPVDPPKGRAHFAAARAQLDSLAPRDRALLAASAPYFDDPPDLALWAKQMRALAGQRPADLDVAYWEAYALWRFADAKGALEAAARAKSIAPDAIRPRWLSAIVRAELDADIDGAIGELDACVAAIPTASACHGQRALFLAERGRCVDLESAARTWVARSPSSPGARMLLGSALVARDAPRGAAEQAWNDATEHALESAREETRARGSARIALHYGDFAAAERALEAWIGKSGAREDVDGRIGPVAELAALESELGKTAEVERLALALDREPALARDASVWWLTAQDTTMSPALVLAHAARRDVSVHREAWIQRALAWEKVGRAPRGFAWITGVARFVETPEDAAIALSSDLPRPDTTRWLPAQLTAWTGGVYALGGRPADALPLLRRATAACDAWLWPGGDLARARLRLGIAAAETGARDEARTILGGVASRWPGTTTGRAARRRLDALGVRP